MSHGERAQKVNRKKDHDWHMKQRSRSGRRVGNLPYEWNENNSKTTTNRRERRAAKRSTLSQDFAHGSDARTV